jgi:hypothetical protein
MKFPKKFSADWSTSEKQIKALFIGQVTAWGPDLGEAFQSLCSWKHARPRWSLNFHIFLMGGCETYGDREQARRLPTWIRPVAKLIVHWKLPGDCFPASPFHRWMVHSIIFKSINHRLLTMKVHRFRALDSFGIRALASFRSASLLVGLGVAPPVTRKGSAFGSGGVGLWNFGLAAGQVEVYWKWTNHLWPAGAETSTGKYNTTASLSDNLLNGDECVCGWTCTHLTQARKPS